MISEGFFTETEVGIYNAVVILREEKMKVLSICNSTGFEAIIGTLYLQKDYERLKIIFDRHKNK